MRIPLFFGTVNSGIDINSAIYQKFQILLPRKDMSLSSRSPILLFSIR